MKLLIVTQVVDTEHPILGFFHRWILEFSKHCEHIHVVALQVGKHSLPTNVTVHSLGKEQGANRFSYILKFYKLIWSLRSEYDNVFVHMNQIYVILGAPFWRLWGKTIGLWYAHGAVTKSLQLAEKLTHKIFSASEKSFRLKSKKLLVTGHGIDVEHFSLQKNTPKTIDLITVGRITEVKNLFALIDIFMKVRVTHDVTLTFIGVSVTEGEREYERQIKKYVVDQGLAHKVNFAGQVSQDKLPTILNQAKVFVTAAKNGSLDKAFLEAASCGVPIVSMASGSTSLPVVKYQVTSEVEMVEGINMVLESNVYFSEESTDYMKNNHNISSLIQKILKTTS